jgi:hypothetical protein
MISQRLALLDVEGQRLANVSAEFRRALLTSEQVVINRAYLYNNSSVSLEYKAVGPRRRAFGSLLADGAIVPYLYAEKSPTERPRRMDTDESSFFSWQRLCEDYKPKCLRLSWDDAENRAATEQLLEKRFHGFVQTLNLLDARNLLVDLGYAPSSSPVEAFSRQLRKIARYALDADDEGYRVTRNQLYQKFITADGTDVTAGIYDKDKLFTAELKQLLDLSYNVNLPDAIDRYPLTPVDSLHRAALQELLLERKPASITSDELAHHLRRAAFSLSHGIAREQDKDRRTDNAVIADMFNGLSLSTIVKVRNDSNEWHDYISHVRELLLHPLTFGEGGADRVFEGYSNLLRHASDVQSADTGRQLGERLLPGAALVVEVGGAVLTILIGDDTALQVAGTVGSIVSGKALPVIVRLVTGGLTRRGRIAAVSSSIDILRRQLQDAEREWEDLVKQLRAEPSFLSLTAERAGHEVANVGESDR